jgi:hypothetical protein
MSRYTDFPNGMKGRGFMLAIQTAEDTDTEEYTLNVGSGLTSYGGLWMESDGLHWSYNGTEYYITSSYSGSSGGTAVGDFDGVYDNGRSITMDKGAITLTDATTGTGDMFDMTVSGAKSGDVFDIGIDAALTGKVFNIDMNLGIAAECIYIDNGATARTAADIHIKDDSTGTHSTIDIDKSGSGASTTIDVTSSYSGSPGGSMISLTYGNGCSLNTNGILVTRGTGVMSAPVINIDDASTGSADIIDIDLSGVYTGDVFDFASSAAATGNVFFINLDNAVAMTAFHVEGSGVRTQPMIEVATDCTGSSDLIDIAVTGASSGNIVDIDVGAAVTGNVIDIDLNAGVGAKAIYIDCGAATRTVPAIDMKFDGDGNVQALNIDATNTGSGNIIDIDVDAVHTGNAIDITYATAAATGDAIAITTGTNLAGNALQITTAGARTAPVINIVGEGTDAGTDDHIILITQSAILNSNMIQLTYDTAASDGDAIGITMGTNVDGSAIVISGSGSRTGDLIQIDDSSTGNSHTFDINFSGVYTGNCLDVTYASAAATGNAIDLNMGTNVAGIAVDIASAATGVDNKGAAINIAHTGDLVQGATVIRVDSTSNFANADGNMVELIQRTGAGKVGNNVLYISAGGTNVEAIKVDDGKVVFDETLTVTGESTLGVVTYKKKAETVAAANIITAAESGTVFFLNDATEFASTLPAPAAGLHFKFVVTGAPSGADYTITTNASANIIKGGVVCSDGNAGDTTTGEDTISFKNGVSLAGDFVEVDCDGTNWFVFGYAAAQNAIVFSNAS